ncbi:MAG: Cu-processing system permease protein [Marinobacter psychrophilus]
MLVFDFLLLGSLVASEGKLNPELLPWSLMLNPTDIYRLLNILAFC